MSNTTDTTCFDIEDPNFRWLGKRLTWNVDGLRQWSQMYEPTRQAIQWDGAHEQTNSAIGSHLGHFRYVTIRQHRNCEQGFVPRSNYEWGKKVSIIFNHGTDDETKVSGYIVENRSA